MNEGEINIIFSYILAIPRSAIPLSRSSLFVDGQRLKRIENEELEKKPDSQ